MGKQDIERLVDLVLEAEGRKAKPVIREDQETPVLTWDGGPSLSDTMDNLLDNPGAWENIEGTEALAKQAGGDEEKFVELLKDTYNDETGDSLYDEIQQSVEGGLPDDSELEWEDLLANLDDLLKEINPRGEWYAEVSNFGWRHQSGHKEFRVETAKEFLHNILPNTDCHFKIYADEAKKEIRINNFHHDSPTGEWYTLTPIAYGELEITVDLSEEEQAHRQVDSFYRDNDLGSSEIEIAYETDMGEGKWLLTLTGRVDRLKELQEKFGGEIKTNK